MSVLPRAVHHGGRFGRPYPPGVRLGFRVRGRMLRLRSSGGAAALSLQLFIWQLST